MVDNSFQHLRREEEQNTQQMRAVKDSLTHTIATLCEQTQRKMLEEMTK